MASPPPKGGGHSIGSYALRAFMEAARRIDQFASRASFDRLENYGEAV